MVEDGTVNTKDFQTLYEDAIFYLILKNVTYIFYCLISFIK